VWETQLLQCAYEQLSPRLDGPVLPHVGMEVAQCGAGWLDLENVDDIVEW
jgi:hypothetical protein